MSYGVDYFPPGTNPGTTIGLDPTSQTQTKFGGAGGSLVLPKPPTLGGPQTYGDPAPTPPALTQQQIDDINAHPEARGGTGHFTDLPSTLVAPPPPPPGTSPSSTPDPTSGTTTPGTPGPLSDPGAYEAWAKAHAGDFNNPTGLETAVSGGALDPLKTSALSGMTPGNGDAAFQAWLAANGGQPSAGNSSGVLGSLPTGPSNSTGVYGRASGALSDPGAYEEWMKAHGGDLNGKGYTEQLYESGMGTLDPYYDNASKRAIAAAQTASAARGGFNNGLTAQQESDILGNLEGQHAKAWVDLASIADASKLSRVQGAAGLSKTAQDEENKRYTDLSQIASAGDQADTARSNTRVSAANNADQNAIGAYMAGANAQNQSGTLSVNQQNANTSLGTQQDQSALNRTKEQLDAIQQSDAQGRQRLIDQGNVEKSAQDEGQQRLQGAINNTFGLGSQEADLATKIYGDMSSVNSLDDTWLQAEADKYGISLQEMKDIMGGLSQVGGMITKVVTGK